MEVTGQLYVPAALTPGKGPLVPLGRRLGWLQSLSDAVVKKKIPIPVRTQAPDHPARSPTPYHWAIPAPNT